MEINDLKLLCDDPDTFTYTADRVLFTRFGEDVELHLKTVNSTIKCKINDDTYIDLDQYIKFKLLRLDLLADQIKKSTKQSAEKFVDSTAIINNDEEVESVATHLASVVREKGAYETQIIQLMATAGQGKTKLLENLGHKFASKNQPEDFEEPIIVTVDLLGRVISTIPDSIAGTLLNTYKFRNIKQTDFILCMKKNWIVLALDGFDELAARIGAKDAVMKINDLLEQLDGNGTIILSGRTTFFNSTNVSLIFETYLKPKIGFFKISRIELNVWEDNQFEAYLKLIGDETPDDTLAAIKQQFKDNIKIIQTPFFFVKIVELQPSQLPIGSNSNHYMVLIKYLIDSYIDRETDIKWQTNNNPIISREDHISILSAISEEMWKTNLTEIRKSDLLVLTEMIMTAAKFNKSVVDEVVSKIGIHAALESSDQMYRFGHEQYFWYYLGYRLSLYLKDMQEADLVSLTCDKQISLTAVDWVLYHFESQNVDVKPIIDFLCTTYAKYSNYITRENIATVLSQLLPVVDEFYINGVSFDKLQLSQNNCFVTFSNTTFSELIGDNCKLQQFHIVDSHIGTLSLRNTACADAKIEDCTIDCLITGDTEIYNPAAIRSELNNIGFPVTKRPEIVERNVYEPFIRIVKRSINMSNTGTYFVAEDLKYSFKPADVDVFVEAGLRNKIFSTIDKVTSGAQKKFLRYDVNKQEVLNYLNSNAVPSEVIEFWNDLSKQRRPNM